MQPYYPALAFVLPAAISFALGLVTWRHRRSRIETLMAMTMFAAGLWSLGYSLGLASRTRFFLDLWGTVEYVGITTTPLLFFFLVSHYAGIDSWLTRRVKLTLWIIPVLTVAFRITDPMLPLIHRATHIVTTGPYTFQTHEPGPWFWVAVCYSDALLWGSVLALLYFRSSARVRHRRDMLLLVLGGMAPFIGNVAYITGYRPLGFVDLTPVGLAFSTLAVAWAGWHHRIFEIMPVARTALVDGFPDGLLMLDRLGRILDLNAAAGEMLGLDTRKSIGKNIDKALAAWPALRDLCHIEHEGRAEFERNGHSGAREYLEARITFLRQDEASARLVVLTDITERKRAEEERRQLEGQLRHSQRLDSIGTLAGGVAHEINNPINGIMNYAQLIKDRLDEESSLKGFAAEIIVETQRVATIVRNLLTFARQEKQEHSPARMVDIVEATASLIGTIIRRDQISLELNVPEELPQLKCRSQQIQQVVMNLMTNARDALNQRYKDYDDNKVIRVSAHAFESEGHRWIRTTVEDHGNGIPEEVRERMFDPFFTTKDRAEGTGLGLSISHGIVKDHHGSLSVESEPGEYTRFHLDLLVDNGWELREE